MDHFGAMTCKRFLIESVKASFDDVTNVIHDLIPQKLSLIAVLPTTENVMVHCT